MLNGDPLSWVSKKTVVAALKAHRLDHDGSKSADEVNVAQVTQSTQAQPIIRAFKPPARMRPEELISMYTKEWDLRHQGKIFWPVWHHEEPFRSNKNLRSLVLMADMYFYAVLEKDAGQTAQNASQLCCSSSLEVEIHSLNIMQARLMQKNCAYLLRHMLVVGCRLHSLGSKAGSCHHSIGWRYC